MSDPKTNSSNRKELRILNTAALTGKEIKELNPAPTPCPQTLPKGVRVSVSMHDDLFLAIKKYKLTNSLNLSELINKNLGKNLLDKIGRENLSSDIIAVFEKER